MVENKKMILWAGILGASGVIFGAFGAHWLKAALEPKVLNSFNTGVRYQLYHALFLLALANSGNHLTLRNMKVILSLTLIGVLFFSGSIYLLCLGPLIGSNLTILGPITPLGGLFLISAWTLLAFSVFSKKKA